MEISFFSTVGDSPFSLKIFLVSSADSISGFFKSPLYFILSLAVPVRLINESSLCDSLSINVNPPLSEARVVYLGRASVIFSGI